jgi:single-strand DNA-binding protein
MNEIITTVVGNLVAEPRLSLVGNSFKTTFRIASTPRWFNPKTDSWQDGTTTYVNVNCWRKLAENANDCLRKGQSVIVHGRLSQREFETKEGERRWSLEIDATNIGHDLSRTMAVARKLARTTPEEDPSAEESSGGEGAEMREVGPEDVQHEEVEAQEFHEDLVGV